MQVKSDGVRRTERRLHLTGERRQHMIGRQCRRNNQIELLRLYARLCECPARRSYGQPSRCLLHSQMPCADSGPAADPLVRCIHDLCQVVICYALFGKGTSGSTYFNHPILLICNLKISGSARSAPPPVLPRSFYGSPLKNVSARASSHARSMYMPPDPHRQTPG